MLNPSDGEASTCTATVTDEAASEDIPPNDVTGSVRFSTTASGSFAVGSCTLEVVSVETSRCSDRYVPHARGSGSHAISARYGGDSRHLTSEGEDSVTVVGLTETTIACDPSRSEAGEASTCTAIVRDLSLPSSGRPGGEVRFNREGPSGSFPYGSSCALSPGAEGEAACAVTYVPGEAGHHLISAAYQGEATRQASASQGIGRVIVPDPTTTTLDCKAALVAVGRGSSCKVTVTDTAAHPFGLAGSVGLAADEQGTIGESASCERIDSAAGAPASCEFTYTPAKVGSGFHRIAASFNGDDGHRPSSGTVLLHVLSTTALSCAPFAATLGAATTCTVTVRDVSSAPSAPRGSVEFASNQEGAFGNGGACDLAPAGAEKATCQLTYTPTALGTRFHQITASYGGDAAHPPDQATATIKVSGSRIRYAAPGGTGVDPCADPENPCSIFTAADSRAPGTSIVANDEVVLEPGDYSDGDLGPEGTLLLERGISVHGEDGKPRPVIDRGGEEPSISVLAGDAVSHVEIVSAQPGALVEVLGGVLEDTIARSSGGGGPVCSLGGGLIRDTVCLNSGDFGWAAGFSLFAAGGTTTVHLRNVTAISTGGGSTGLSFQATGLNGSPRLDVDASGVIARGTVFDVAAEGVNGPEGETAGTVEVHFDHSDYKKVVAIGSGPAIAFVTEPGTGTNIVDPPRLDADGYHESSDSPTVDRGATDQLSGASDIDGQLRTIGPAADIGADELAHGTGTRLLCFPGVLGLAAGNSATCTATVTDVSASPTPPGGRVELASDGEGSFGNGGSCTLVSIGPEKARCRLSYTPTEVGEHSIDAAYRGDGRHEPSSDRTSIDVGRIRYAAPQGTGADPCADPKDPCSLFMAASSDAPATTLAAGDEVILAPGTYSGLAEQFPNEGVYLPEGVSMHGAAGKPRPVFVLDRPDNHSESLLVRPDDFVSHLEVEGIATNLITLRGGVLDDVVARSSEAEAFACRWVGEEKVLIRDSACLSSGPRSIAVGSVGSTSARSELDLRNVTAVASGGDSVGLFLFENGQGQRSSVDVNATAVIAAGTEKDIKASAVRAGPADNPPDLAVNLDHSDYRTVQASAEAGGSAEITPPGSATNIESAPLLAADGYHELANSPTVDAGALDELSGEFDIDGQPRTIGPAADVGADEAKARSETVLTCSPDAVEAARGQSTTCTATVGVSVAEATPPSGAVEFTSDQRGAFSDGATCTLAAASGGKASCHVTYSPSAASASTHTILASYRGDLARDPSRGTAKVQIKAPRGAGPPSPDTRIAKKPRAKTTSRRAKFAFVSSQPGSSFQCKLDARPFGLCRSPYQVRKLKAGRHTFEVRAISAEGVVDPTPAIFHWTVRRTPRARR